MEEPLHRFVTRRSLAGLKSTEPVGSAAIEISSADLVSTDLPLADALSLLVQRPWFFVLDGHKVNAIPGLPAWRERDPCFIREILGWRSKT